MLLEDEGDETRPRGFKNPTPLCAPSFVKSRMLRPLQTHFSLFQQILFVLDCIHPGTPRLPPRVFGLWVKTLRGQKARESTNSVLKKRRVIKQQKAKAYSVNVWPQNSFIKHKQGISKFNTN